LPSALFVANDEEMTGINVDFGRPRRDQSPAEQYDVLKQAPERYSIIQLGVSLFHEANPANTTGNKTDNQESTSSDAKRNTKYLVRRYNFYMFPGPAERGEEPREVVLNPSAVAFLHKHNMSFDLWISKGIPYVIKDKAKEHLDTFVSKDRASKRKTNTKDAIQSDRMELHKTEDIDFVNQTMASLQEWLKSKTESSSAAATTLQTHKNTVEGVEPIADKAKIEITPEGKSFLLTPCNSFLRRALFKTIESEYPTLELEGEGNRIRVWRLTDEEKLLRKQRLRREAWKELIGHKIGMWRIFEALRCACSGHYMSPNNILFAESYDQIDWENPLQQGSTQKKLPLVVHNGFMDILFLLTHFHSSKLPDEYQECKKLISNHFPILYDTKVLATECACLLGGNANEQNASNTNLSNLFEMFVSASLNGDPRLMEQLQVVQSQEHQGMIVEDQEHEAAYDAYMTGAVFLGLCQQIRRNAPVSPDVMNVLSNIHSREARFHYGRNKLYQFSMYTMDLEEPRANRDPMSRGMTPASTYRVSGFDKSLTTHDIVRCLSGLTDSIGRTVNFDIVWIDDSTFLVAASYRITSSDQNTSNDALNAVLKDHGQIIHRALRKKFQNEKIIVFEDHVRELDVNSKAITEQNISWLDHFLSMLGLMRKKPGN
jgi:hypothetical protein